MNTLSSSGGEKLPNQAKQRQLRAKRLEKNRQILENFSPDEQHVIQEKKRILSCLAAFIGRDFSMPVEIGEPSGGWQWDARENAIIVDAEDLLTMSIEQLRFIICQKAGERRISRTAQVVPNDLRNNPGFAWMTKCIETPRVSNFVASAYPAFHQLLLETDMLGEAERMMEIWRQQCGLVPRFVQAGFELMRLWQCEMRGEHMTIDSTLPPEVQDVIGKTIAAAQESWQYYPSKDEAELGEQKITAYAQQSFTLNATKVWPLFKTLMDQDMQDQAMQQMLENMQGNEESEEESALEKKLKEKLSPEMQKALEEAMKNAKRKKQEKQKKKKQEKQKESEEGTGEESDEETESGEDVGGENGEADGSEGEEEGEEGSMDASDSEGQNGMPFDIDSLPEELKQALLEAMQELSEEARQEFEERAEAMMKEAVEAMEDELDMEESERGEVGVDADEEPTSGGMPPEDFAVKIEEEQKALEEFRRKLDTLMTPSNDRYSVLLSELSTLISELTAELRRIFLERKKERWQPGSRHGRKWDIATRIKEKIQGVHIVKTESRCLPGNPSEEKDYAVTLLIDLSGSMRWDGKIEEALKCAIVLAETLQALGISFEISGFQDKLLVFKEFSQPFNDDIRQKLLQMIDEAHGRNPGGNNHNKGNDDGACLRGASDNLGKQRARNKLLLALSDGEPSMPSEGREATKQRLRDAVAHVEQATDQILVGIGINATEVAKYYPTNIPGVKVEEMVELLRDILRESIASS